MILKLFTIVTLMKEIPYRNTKLSVQIMPKGTLLFRVTRTPENDFKGVPLQDGSFCIIPNFNVFFYPSPIVMKVALSDKFLKEVQKFDTMYAYILTKDIQVIRLINPAKQSSNLKLTKRNFIKNCNDVSEGCMTRPLSKNDPCLSKTIIEKYPDIVGMLSLSKKDSEYLRKHSIPMRGTKKRMQYLKMAEDADGNKGIPELIIHPLTKRPSKQLIVTDEPLEHNYKILTKFSLDDEDGMMKFMDKHARFNPKTLYYNYTE
jgi:hypothetical protein